MDIVASFPGSPGLVGRAWERDYGYSSYQVVLHCASFVYLSFIFTGAPRLVTVTSVNSTTVIVSWSEVQCFNGNGAVTHYLVQCHSIYDGAIRNVTTNSSEQEMIVSGLSSSFALWTFRVAAVYNQNVGPFSNFFNSRPLGKQVNS